MRCSCARLGGRTIAKEKESPWAFAQGDSLFDGLQRIRRCLKNGNVSNGEKFFRQTKPI